MTRSDQLIDEATSRPRRAVAMPPDERRAAIAAATVPLLLERGLAVTTKDIASAAGIAEGTIFRAFPDKDAVVQAAVEAAFDPAVSEQALAEIDPDLGFEDQLAEAAAILQRRMEVIWRLVSLVGNWPDRPKRPPDSPALVELFAPHADRLRLDPTTAAYHFRALVLAVSHPALAANTPPPTPPEIVNLLLDGIRSRP